MIDIYDSLWAPRLIIHEVSGLIKNLFDKREYKKVRLPMSVHEEEHLYPRPKLIRDSYFSLNGEWEFAPAFGYDPDNISDSAMFTKTVRVPYPVESYLSGVSNEDVNEEFAYRKIFRLPEGFIKKKVFLHFGAVDQECKVYLNGKYVGNHEGGYLPFTFDVTGFLEKNGKDNELIVKVRDMLDHKYPYGKQTKEPDGMWYTRISGIWQTVWLESVQEHFVKKIICKMEGQKDHADDTSFDIDVFIEGMSDDYELTIYEPRIENKKYPENENRAIPGYEGLNILKKYHVKNGSNIIKIDWPKLWSPEEPYIYRISVLTDEDLVGSYFTMRSISIKDINGKPRICLNNRPCFLHGILDQGYYSDGLYTPLSDRYYEDDIRNMKELGFNVIRKHLKIEPECFYYDCDRLGMLVFQDMVNNGKYSFIRQAALPTFAGQWKDDKDITVPEEIRGFFIRHSLETIRHLKGYECIICYTVFNEGWGQFDSIAVTKKLREEDPDKIYDSASGWFKQEKNDIDSDHFYYHKIKPHKWTRPVIISECGGFIRMIPDHSCCPDKTYGYGKCDSMGSLTDRIFRMYDEEVIPNMENGICGCIYTQLSDVETEVNGLYTYDRGVCKINKARMKELAFKLAKAYSYITGDDPKVRGRGKEYEGQI